MTNINKLTIFMEKFANECGVYMNLHPEECERFMDNAKQALERELDGYALVPTEPTEAMIKAARDSIAKDTLKPPYPDNFTITGTMYKAMISAKGES